MVMANTEDDLVKKFHRGQRMSARLFAKMTSLSSHDTAQGEEEDQVGDLPSFTKPASGLRRKIYSEPPTSASDEQLTDSTRDEDRPKKRRRLSVGNNDPTSRPITSSKTAPAPPDPEVQETPPREAPRTRSKTTPAPSNPEVPETPLGKAHQSLRSPESTATQDSNTTENNRIIPLSESKSAAVNGSPASTATFGGEEEPKTADETALAEQPADSNADGTTATVPPAEQKSPQLSIPETVLPEAMAPGAAAPDKESLRQVLSPPNSSPLSTPPSSPTLNAQAPSVDMSSATNIEEPALQPSGTVTAADEPSEESNINDSPSADTASPANRTDGEDRNSHMAAGQQNGTSTTPVSKAPSQLPTPPSSSTSDAEVPDKFSMIKGSGRIRKPIERFGEPVETPPIPEEMEDQLNPDAMDVEFETSPTNTRKASAKPKNMNARGSATKTTTPAKSKAGVNKSGTSYLVSKPSLASKSTPKPRGRPPMKLHTTASVISEGGNGTKSSKKLKLIISIDPKRLKTIVATPGATKGRKKPSAKAEAVTKTPTAAKAPSRKNRMNQPIVVLASPDHHIKSIKLDESKLELSRRLSKRQPLESKPEPQGQPTVWAESRQALCETLPYFKKPQGGCYSNDGHVYGFLFDGVGHCREYLDENLILCRAGGSMEADSTNGGMAQKKDQSFTESQVQSIINDIKHRNPLIVICGNRNVAAPARMPHQYNVLGWYKPVFVWAEKTQGKGTNVWTTIKYRLERLNQHLDPAWHSPKDNSLTVSEEDKAIPGPLVSMFCEYCKTTSPQIYLQGWMCLTPSCDAFWQLNGGDAPYGREGLDYDPAFLLHRYALWKSEDEVAEPVPVDVKPSVPKVGDIIGDNLYYVNTRGVCCPECGRCNSRRKFSGWKCENPSCSWSFSPDHKPVLPTMLHTPWDAAPTLVRNRHADGVHIESSHSFGYKVSKYTFDGIKGCFLHLAASKEQVTEGHGANDMFAALQTVDMGLERRIFATTKMSSARSEKAKDSKPEPTATQEDAELGDEHADEVPEEFAAGDLMTAFSMNYGMPYKFVASGGSQSFEEAPWPVKECRRRLNWAQKTFLTEQSEYMDFNEQLIFAYLEGQKIEYHDDGESGLGPRIATFSLGGRAKMHMRIKAKHYVGCSKTGIFTEERPVPGSIDGEAMYKQRLEKWEELQTIREDTTAYNKRRKEIPKELGLFEKRTKKAQDLVTVTLSHGDIIIMDGYDIQKYLEHKVVPEGYLRFALTCRTVLPDHLKPEELPSYKVDEDPVKYDGPRLSRTSNDEGAMDLTPDT